MTLVLWVFAAIGLLFCGTILSFNQELKKKSGTYKVLVYLISPLYILFYLLGICYRKFTYNPIVNGNDAARMYVRNTEQKIEKFVDRLVKKDIPRAIKNNDAYMKMHKCDIPTISGWDSERVFKSIKTKLGWYDYHNVWYHECGILYICFTDDSATDMINQPETPVMTFDEAKRVYKQTFSRDEKKLRDFVHELVTVIIPDYVQKNSSGYIALIGERWELRGSINSIRLPRLPSETGLEWSVEYDIVEKALREYGYTNIKRMVHNVGDIVIYFTDDLDTDNSTIEKLEANGCSNG